MIPVNEPIISAQARANVIEALDGGWLSSAGPFVARFEKEFASYVRTKGGVAVANGTAALHVALLSLGIGAGDEVIVPAFTMAATWLAVLYTGAKPVFVDAEPDTFNIDPKLIESAITLKTKAIMVVHIYGHPCDMDPIMAIAKKHSLKVIEDAAEAHGATYNGKRVGSIGDVACFSFYANKIITTGEGGMVVSNDEQILKECSKLRDLYHSDTKRFIHEKIGYNYRMTNLQAAVGCGELANIDQYLEKKRSMATLYTAGLSDIKGIVTPTNKAYATNVFWMYAILITDQFPLSKDAFRTELKKKGVDTRDFFYAPEDQPVLKEVLAGKTYPIASDLARRGLYLPSGLAITKEQIESVVSTIKELAI